MKINDTEMKAMPDFSIPSKDCFLTEDKNGIKLRVGDILTSNNYQLRGHDKVLKTYSPIEFRDGKLIVPHFGSYLLRFYVEAHCTILNQTES